MAKQHHLDAFKLKSHHHKNIFTNFATALNANIHWFGKAQKQAA